MNDYTQLRLKDRRRISIYLEMGLKIKEIANKLGRHKATIYRELQRNRTGKYYLPGVANDKALKRKEHNRPCKLKSDRKLYGYFLRKLRKGWSPEQISGRLKKRNKKYYASPETMYRYIYRGNNKRLCKYLPQRRLKRKKRYTRSKRQNIYLMNRLVYRRPEEINNRETYGHWEGDSLEFSTNRKKMVVTLVERKTRAVMLIKNEERKSEKVMTKIADKSRCVVKKAFCSVTFDQGKEFSNFWKLERNGCAVYYCESRSPWQKGSNENMNGRLRRYLSRDTNLDLVGQWYLDLLSKKMNNTPRKCLGFRTPKEKMQQFSKILDRNIF